MKSGDIVIFDRNCVDNIDPADEDGFKIIIAEPDKMGTIPVQRVSDGDFQCLPIEVLKKMPTKIKGRFYKTLSGRILFEPSDKIKGASLGFEISSTNNPFGGWISKEIEFELLK